MVYRDLTDKVMFEQKLKGSKRKSHSDISGVNIPGRRNNKDKSPEANT